MKTFYNTTINQLGRALELVREHESLLNKILELQPELQETIEKMDISLMQDEMTFSEHVWEYYDLKYCFDDVNNMHPEHEEIVDYILEEIIPEMVAIIREMASLDLSVFEF